MIFKLYHPQAIHELGQRQNQEDAIFPLPDQVNSDHRVFVVCDGMGGLDKGEVASEAVCKTLGRVAETILHTLGAFTDDDLAHCMNAAYEALDAADTDNEATMGTTMTFLCFHEQGCLVAHIGDSRIYHLRPSLGAERGVLFRSRDHSLVHQLYELGEISYNDMAKYPKKNIILKGIQPHQAERTRASLAHIADIRPGDYFYMCTDGMLEVMDDERLMEIVSDPTMTDEQKAQCLIDETSDNADNHTAWLIHVESVTKDPEKDKDLPDDELAHRIRNKVLNDRHRDQAWHFDDAIPMPDL